ncbi:MAG: hypothetical protein IPI38_14155 [Gemmatimonadetes bacterium]|nr:hypothetical protein [Gemmatimonadota bacterium]
MRADGTEDFVSQRGLAYAGYSQEEMRTRWIETITRRPRAPSPAGWRGYGNNAPFQTEFRHRRATAPGAGTSCAAPVREFNGVIVRWVGSLSDIHEAQVLRERLHAQENGSPRRRR